jgi:uncharacterized protein YjbI with pentapeptide repeats
MDERTQPPEGYQTWNAYWTAQGMPWRREPEIPAERQAYLAVRRGVAPDTELGVYPFKGVEPKLTRADIEWLLATHDGGRGPVIWVDEQDKARPERRRGLDLRGAHLRGARLAGLPLTRMLGGLHMFDYDWQEASEEVPEQAQAHLEGADLSGARLEGATLRGAQLELANLAEAHLEGAILVDAQMKDAYLNGAHMEEANLSAANLTAARLRGAQLQGAAFNEASLERAILDEAQLEGALFRRASLRGASLRGARLEGAIFFEAHLQGADLTRGAQLAGADLSKTQLDGANLSGALLKAANLTSAQLTVANLRQAQLTDANLFGARLDGADLREAWLVGADLRGASLDKSTHLNDAHLSRASLDQTIFDNTNLSVVKWGEVPVLGDELTARAAKDAEGNTKRRRTRSNEYQAAARAYRRLAVALQTNGMSEEASEYLYRAQIMQRRLRWHQRQLGAYLFSVLLAVLAGYGYRLGRIAVAYCSVVAIFALGYLGTGLVSEGTLGAQQILDAFQISLNAIHGRVFFAQFGLDTLQSWLATVESVLGIVIEGVLVAMLIQRFFVR